MTIRGKKGPLAVGGVVGALLLAGCGSDNSYENRLRPPEPVVVAVSVSPRSVSASPTAIGGGPITIVITNQTKVSQQLTLESAGDTAGIQQDTGPINPSDTATMKANVVRGRYRIRVSGAGIHPATLVVGRMRPSSQNDLLQP